MKEKDNVELFIENLIQLAQDEFDKDIEAIQSGYVDMQTYFYSIGCLELAKVLQYFIPSARICIHEELKHFAIRYQENVYDAYGKHDSSSDFQDITSDYLEQHEEKYEHDIVFEGKPVHIALIQEIKACSGNYISDLIASINNEEYKRKLNINQNKSNQN